MLRLSLIKRMGEEENDLYEEIQQIINEHTQENLEIDTNEFQEWMDKLVDQTDKYDYLEGVTSDMLQKEIYDLLDTLDIDPETKEQHKQALKTYRLVKHISDFHVNGSVRRMDRGPPYKLYKCAPCTGIIFSGKNTLVKVRVRRIVYNYSMDRYYTFQKLSAEESMIVYVNDCASQ